MNILRVVYLFLMFTIPFSLSAQNQNSVEGDWQALMDLYESTNGQEWWNNSGWENSSPETMGEMYGITVWEDGENEGRVKEIDLFQNNLVGTLPLTIGNLSKCEVLKLKQPYTDDEYYSDPRPDKIDGGIPPSIGNMVSLKWLSLSGQYDDIQLEPKRSWNEENHGANISGQGKTFSNGNYFTGQLPPEIGNLINLEMLEIRRHGLTGSIPSEIGKLSSLIGLFLNGTNDGDGPGGNEALSGPIPPEIGNLRNLVHLHLNRNKLTGVIPPEINNLSQLWHLRIGRNHYDPHELPMFDRLQNIHTFKLQFSNLIGRFPTELFEDGRNLEMHNFTIHFNDLSGELPSDLNISIYDNLVIFKVSGNNYTGSIPNWVTQMRVIQFDFDHNNFSGNLPAGFHDSDSPIYDRIRNLRLNSNNLTGPLPDANLGPSIYVIGLGNNNFTGTLPESWGDIVSSRNIKLSVDQNQLSGPIPVEILGMVTLASLDISENKFSQSDLQPIIDLIDSSVEFSYLNQNPSDDGDDDSGDETPVPDTPELTFPENTSTGISTVPEFSWSSVDADFYQLWIEESHNSEVVLEADTGTNSYSLTNSLDYETTYRWRVRAVKDGVEGDWSPTWTFETEVEEVNDDEDEDEPTNSVDAPQQISPENGLENESLRPVFEWSVVEDAEYYILHANRLDPSVMVIDEEVTGISFQPDNDLEPNTGYHWRVRAVVGGEPGEWSEIRGFTTKNAETEEEPAEEPEIVLDQNYPNPFNPSTQIRFNLTESQQVSLKVYNMAGQLMTTLVDGTITSGSHEVIFRADNLASGVYFYRLVTENRIFTRKMTLLK